MSVLASTAWGVRHFGGILTNNQLPRRDMLRCVREGLAVSIGMVEQCDDDGCMLPNRALREGFALTEAGWDMLIAHDPYYAEERRVAISMGHYQPPATPRHAPPEAG